MAETLVINIRKRTAMTPSYYSAYNAVQPVHKTKEHAWTRIPTVVQ